MGANGSCVWTGQCLRNLLDISVETGQRPVDILE